MGLRGALMRVAKEWRVKPSALGLCAAEDDLTYMLAWVQAETRMLAWEQQEAEREAKARAKVKGK